MISVVLVTEAEQTQRAITALIALLVVVAAMLALLTFWYWQHTSPKRRYRGRLASDFDSPDGDEWDDYDYGDDAYDPFHHGDGTARTDNTYQ